LKPAGVNKAKPVKQKLEKKKKSSIELRVNIQKRAYISLKNP